MVSTERRCAHICWETVLRIVSVACVGRGIGQEIGGHFVRSYRVLFATLSLAVQPVGCCIDVMVVLRTADSQTETPCALSRCFRPYIGRTNIKLKGVTTVHRVISSCGRGIGCLLKGVL